MINFYPNLTLIPSKFQVFSKVFEFVQKIKILSFLVEIHSFFDMDISGIRQNFHKKIQKRGRADWFIDADAAMRIGLVDKVGLPKLHIDVNVDIKFVDPL